MSQKIWLERHTLILHIKFMLCTLDLTILNWVQIGMQLSHSKKRLYTNIQKHWGYGYALGNISEWCGGSMWPDVVVFHFQGSFRYFQRAWNYHEWCFKKCPLIDAIYCINRCRSDIAFIKIFELISISILHGDIDNFQKLKTFCLRPHDHAVGSLQNPPPLNPSKPV